MTSLNQPGLALFSRHVVVDLDNYREHRDCAHLVIDVDHDPHAPALLEFYASLVREERPELAHVIDQVLALLDGRPPPKPPAIWKMKGGTIPISKMDSTHITNAMASLRRKAENKAENRGAKASWREYVAPSFFDLEEEALKRGLEIPEASAPKNMRWDSGSMPINARGAPPGYKPADEDDLPF